MIRINFNLPEFPSDSLWLRRAEPEDQSFAEALLAEAFPRCERRSTAALARALRDPRYELSLLVDRTASADEAAAAAQERLILLHGRWNLTACEYWEHLAVTESCRGHGLGSRLIRARLASLRTQRFDAQYPLILEIEEPMDAVTRRRLAFYERLGFHRNAFPYYQPPYHADCPPLPLWLMTYPAPLDKPTLRRCARCIALEAYGVPRYDPETGMETGAEHMEGSGSAGGTGLTSGARPKRE